MREASMITVVVPAYNQGPYIEQTVKSLLEQSVKPARIIVSNNHSTDETAAVLRQFEDKVEVISPPKFIPAGEHCDFLVSHVETEWCALLSSDDIAEPNYIKAFCDSITEFPDASLVHGGVLYIDKDELTAVPRYALKAKRYALFPDNFVEQLRAPVVNFAAFAFSVKAFRKTGGFTPWLGMGDWPVFLQLAPHGAFIYRKEIIARYRCSYRPNLNHGRFVSFLHDEARISSELIPGILRAAGRSDLEQLHQKHSKMRFKTRLVEYYAYGKNVNQDSALVHLKIWANYLGFSVPQSGARMPINLLLWEKSSMRRMKQKDLSDRRIAA